jgi:electron transfer flavoprotein alpha subunit
VLHVAALIKQIPSFEAIVLGDDGRLQRTGPALEMSAYCRRAVNQAVELAGPSGSVLFLTMGPPAADEVLREALAWSLDRGVPARGVLLTDPAFAGADTLATAHALAAALTAHGPFDVVLTGRSSLDADTGQVPPQVAELLDLPFVTGVKQLAIAGGTLSLGCEHDDAWLDVEVDLPVVLSCAERLCEPAKVPVPRRREVDASLIQRLDATTLGPGPWGAEGSQTLVGGVRTMAIDRLRRLDPDAALRDQVAAAVQVLLDRDALVASRAAGRAPVPPTGGGGPVVAAIAEPNHAELTSELCGLAAALASEVGGTTVLLSPEAVDPAVVGSWGADHIVAIEGSRATEDVAHAVSTWAATAAPWAVLAGSTAYGREVAARAAARLSAGLTGDAVDIEVEWTTAGPRLVAWKSAFGGQLVAAVTAISPLQMVTVRPGVVPRSAPRSVTASAEALIVSSRGRVRIQHQRAEDALGHLSDAAVVIGVGAGVDPRDLGRLDDLRRALDAEIGCTRKVTDQGWMPHSRQIGITGRSIAPRLFVAIGTSGKFNHMVGVRAAGTVLAINPDRDAPVWEHADVGIVASWQDAVPVLVDELSRALATTTGRTG